MIWKEIGFASVATLAAVVGAVCDVRSRRIPNPWTGSCLLAALILHFWSNGWIGLGNAALAGALAGGGFLLLYMAGGMGAGDVKLMAAAGSLGGLAQLPLMLLSTVIAGAVFALVLAACHRQLKHTLGRALDILGSGVARNRGLEIPRVNKESSLSMPFAVPIAVGCLYSLYAQLSR
jgi:prepilin peptidase CpaA